MDFLAPVWGREDYRYAWRSYHPTVMRRLCRVAHLAAVPPSHHTPSPETESRSPVRGQLVAYSCLSVHVHSLPPSVDPPRSDRKSSITEPTGQENGRSCTSTILLSWNTNSTNTLNSSSPETPVVVASCASLSPPQCYLRFEAVTSNSLCLTM